MLLIVDLECTCWQMRIPPPHETIEIGAVALNLEQGVCGEYQRFVKPKLQPLLSDFCKELTTIRQADVDQAEMFPKVFTDFLNWAEQYAPYTLASWGAFDHHQLRRDCQLHGMTYPISEHENIKAMFAEKMGCKPCGMGKALAMLDLPLEGTHHRAIDDVRNIVRIMMVLRSFQ